MVFGRIKLLYVNFLWALVSKQGKGDLGKIILYFVVYLISIIMRISQLNEYYQLNNRAFIRFQILTFTYSNELKNNIRI